MVFVPFQILKRELKLEEEKSQEKKGIIISPLSQHLKPYLKLTNYENRGNQFTLKPKF